MGGHFDIDSIRDELNSLENKLSDNNIWNDVDYANDTLKRVSDLKKNISEYNSLCRKILDNLEILDLIKEEYDDELFNNIKDDALELENKLKEYEVKMLLDGEYDKSACFLEIHPGAGGTEAQDWADMLLRMYTMYFDKNHYKYSIVDKQMANDAGIKSVLIHVENEYAYGYLKGEIGVHRLVRISPFDSQKRRHTSFAAVNVTPEIDDVDDVIINDDELRIDVYRSSGNGGQGVNTTDSAVRITHIPTGIVIAVQNERSQLKNKDIAMKILKSKLKQMQIDERNDKINALKGNDNIEFGSQIRNYILEPYSLVKDLRTGLESNNPLSILDGDLSKFIEAYIRMR